MQEKSKEHAIFVLWIICLVFEGILSIPFVGGVIVVSFLWTPLIFMFLLHVATLIVSIQSKQVKYPSIIGITASMLGAIPFLGWMLHVITVIALSMVLFSYHKKRTLSSIPQASPHMYDATTTDFKSDDYTVLNEVAPSQIDAAADATNEVAPSLIDAAADATNTDEQKEKKDDGSSD